MRRLLAAFALPLILAAGLMPAVALAAENGTLTTEAITPATRVGVKGTITGLRQVAITEDSVSVACNPVDDVAYQIICGTDRDNMPEFPSAEWTNPGDPDNPVFKISGLTAGTTYYVQMRTVDPEIVNGYFEFTYGNPSKIIAVKPGKQIDSTVTLSKYSFEYDGKAKKPSVTVRDGSTVLNPSEYAVAYSKGRKNVGSYKVTVTGKGLYVGTATATFKIAKAANKLAKTKVTKTLKVKSLKKKAATIALPKAKFGKVTWKIYKNNAKKVLSLTKAGKVKVKKGAEVGAYTMKLKANVKGTANYKALKNKVVTVKVTLR